MFAVIKSGGRQFKVSVGQTLEVERLPIDDGEQVRIEDVLLISDADRSMVGTPFVDNAAVLATVERQTRGKKLIVFKYKSKKRYRHRRGHRQELTVLRIDDILAEGKSLITGEAPKVNEKPAQTTATDSRDRASRRSEDRASRRSGDRASRRSDEEE
jgi:large subunit ribosomal protein L21